MQEELKPCPLKKGDRVQLTQHAKDGWIDNQSPRDGTFERYTKDGMVFIRKDGNKIGSSYHPSFWEKISANTVSVMTAGQIELTGRS